MNIFSRRDRPALRGGALALLAALLFGASTPLIARAGEGLGSFWVAGLLYGGAAAAGALTWRPATSEARVRLGDAPRLMAMALCGATLAPVLLVWGLARTSATSASLLLALEACFTVLLARAFYAEHLGGRVLAALALLTAGGALLVADQTRAGVGAQWHGALAVLGATALWGLDNTLSRALAERDPGQVVLAKSILGATATLAMAAGFGQAPPAAGAFLALFLIGALGYGLSLRLYLLAQREFGAARTGSVFAFAPFIGAAVAFGMGERGATLWLVAGATLMLAGVLLHLTERHAHRHAHAPLEHEHAHTHDDGHHLHHHDPQPTRAHSHWHRHEPTNHAHAHVPDAHHSHSH